MAKARSARKPLPPLGSRIRLRIGLLGGSFNPAHQAHREISLTALHRLKLDQVWWLVSPQNPLKQARGMAPLQERLENAIRVSAHPRLIPTDLEDCFGTRFTADTLRALRKFYPNIRFVWLMGADNLSQFPRWQRWQRIVAAMPIAVVDRPGYGLTASANPAAFRLNRHRLPLHAAAALAARKPPAFVFLKTKLNPLSATALRTKRARTAC